MYQAPKPNTIDVHCTLNPMTVEKLDPAFHVPGWLAVSKIVSAFLGSTFTIFAINMQDYKLDKSK